MTILPALAFGFALGMRHATDADHIAAVGNFVVARRSALGAARIGAMWGLGHSMSVLLAGGALVILRVPMPTRLALALEFLVALMLIGLGIHSLRRQGAVAPDAGREIRPLLVGVVHGLAGTAVLALMVIGATPSAVVATVYLVCFGIGTMAGMAAVTVLLALPAQLSPARAIRIDRGVRLASGVASVVIGVLLAHRVGVEDGLFAATLP